MVQLRGLSCPTNSVYPPRRGAEEGRGGHGERNVDTKTATGQVIGLSDKRSRCRNALKRPFICVLSAASLSNELPCLRDGIGARPAIVETVFGSSAIGSIRRFGEFAPHIVTA
jgi:hypothetical protein